MREATPRRGSRPPTGWTQLPLAEPSAPPTPPPAGEWIDALVADVATELGDGGRTAAHQATAWALWRRSGLPESAFAEVLLAVRVRVNRWGGQPAPAAAGGSSVRMGAFFLLLRDRLGLIDAAGQRRRRRRS